MPLPPPLPTEQPPSNGVLHNGSEWRLAAYMLAFISCIFFAIILLLTLVYFRSSESSIDSSLADNPPVAPMASSQGIPSQVNDPDSAIDPTASQEKTAPEEEKPPRDAVESDDTDKQSTPFTPDANKSEVSPEEPNVPTPQQEKTTVEHRVNIQSESVLLTPRMGDLLEENVELFGKVSFKDNGLKSMKNFQTPIIYTGQKVNDGVLDRFDRRPADHLESWKNSRANELELPDRIYRYGSDWNIFDKKTNDLQIFVAWHNPNPEIYIRLDSDHKAIGPGVIHDLRREFREYQKRFLVLRSQIAKLPLVKFASTYKINTKLNRIDFLINQHFRLNPSDTNDGLRSNLQGLYEVLDDLPRKFRQIGLELEQHAVNNEFEINRILINNPPPNSYNPPVFNPGFTDANMQFWENRVRGLTKKLQEEIKAINDALDNVPHQSGYLSPRIGEGITMLQQLGKAIDDVKQLPEIKYTLPESILIRTLKGDQINQKLNFEIVIKD